MLDEAKLLADVQAGVKNAIVAGRSREEIRTLAFPQYAGLRNYNRRENFLEALHHLYTTGRPLFPYGAGQ